MVWEGDCIAGVDTTKAKLTAPMVNGEPDMKHAVISGIKVTYKPACGRIEIQK
jgi:hypothetical protein